MQIIIQRNIAANLRPIITYLTHILKGRMKYDVIQEDLGRIFDSNPNVIIVDEQSITADLIYKANNLKIKLLLVGEGLTAKETNFRLNYHNLWNEIEFKDYNPANPVKLKSGCPLILFQDKDFKSSFFDNFAEFMKFVENHYEGDIKISRTSIIDKEVKEIIEYSSKVLWDVTNWGHDRTPYRKKGSWEGISCIITSNANLAVEAIEDGLPILCFGESIYKQKGVVEIMSNDPLKFKEIFQKENLTIYRSSQQLFLNSIKNIQFTRQVDSSKLEKFFSEIEANIEVFKISIPKNPASSV